MIDIVIIIQSVTIGVLFSYWLKNAIPRFSKCVYCNERIWMDDMTTLGTEYHHTRCFLKRNRKSHV